MSPNNHSLSYRGSEPGEAPPPQWLGRFANRAARAFHSEENLTPVGCHFHEHVEAEISQWEVTLFVSSTEVYGGALDGQSTVSRFMIELRELMEAFDVIESFYWQAQKMADDDQLGPHVGVEGIVGGHSVWLRITAEPPDQFQPGQVFDVCANELEDRW